MVRWEIGPIGKSAVNWRQPPSGDGECRLTKPRRTSQPLWSRPDDQENLSPLSHHALSTIRTCSTPVSRPTCLSARLLRTPPSMQTRSFYGLEENRYKFPNIGIDTPSCYPNYLPIKANPKSALRTPAQMRTEWMSHRKGHWKMCSLEHTLFCQMVDFPLPGKRWQRQKMPLSMLGSTLF